MRKYSYFDECIDLLTTPIEHFSQGHPQQSPLLASKKSIAESYVEDFTLELEKELLSQKSKKQQVNLIKWYVSRLMKSENHRSIEDGQPDSEANIPLTDKNKILSGLTKINDLLIADYPYNPNNELKFMRGCNILYHSLFDELQKCCCTFEIPFLNICSLIGFPIKTINTNISETCKDSDHQNGLYDSQVKSTIPNISDTPRFTEEFIPTIFGFLKKYFSPDEHEELLRILTTGGYVSKHLYFKDKGNHLVDAFKQLKENKIIVSCSKKELSEWITKNFKYMRDGKPIEFRPRYPKEILSETRIDVSNKIFKIIDQPDNGKKQIVNPK